MKRIKSHTLEKLAYFKKYIEAYLVATKRLPVKYYIDAFAGTGKNILCDEICKSKGGKRCIDCGKGKEIDGSVLIALKIKNIFDKYILIELKKKNLNCLKTIIKDEIDYDRVKNIDLMYGDCNKLLSQIHKNIPKGTGCLFFLDPQGSELFWSTIKSLSKIKKADFLILYPYDMSLVRLTTNCKYKLDKFYGTSKWFDIYEGEIDASSKQKKLLDFYINNLKGLDFRIIYRQINTRLREGKRLYHLIYATRHPVGEKIMKHIFNKELDGQQKMKL